MKQFFVWAAIVAACAFGVYKCATSEWFEEEGRAEQAARRAEETPHIIREADGCKVYAFKSGEWHYFTRCGATVTTDRTYTESCGKNCRRSKTETIVTNGNN